MRQPHKTVHAVCPWGVTTWGECDKARDNAYADWQAFQAVLLSYIIVVREERPKGFKGDSLDEQLVQLIRGQRQQLMNKDGNPAVSPWAQRLLAAIERFKAGDFPAYNLYRLPDPPAATEEA